MEGASLAPAETELSESLEECVICFEAIACHASLPCDCKVSYCNKCWDRSLAQSLRTSHRARCPTCRTLVHVDYEQATGQLVFSREPEVRPFSPRTHVAEPVDGGVQESLPSRNASLGVSLDEQLVRVPEDRGTLSTEEEEGWIGEDGVWYSAAEWASWENEVALAEKAWERERRAGRLTRERLAAQVRPTQLKLLRRWGKESIDVEGTTEEKLANLEGSSDVPTCACGGFLQRFTNEGYCPCCMCDLCGRSLTEISHVWTCSNGIRTLVHVMGYDVCEQCFMHHTGILDKDSQ